MELIRGRHNLRAEHRGSAVTIGNFDGLHLGHQSVLELLKERATVLGLPTLVMTFEPSPREYFRGPDSPPRLMSFREKFEGLAAAGIDRLFCLRFDASIARMPPEGFIQELLVEGLGVCKVVIGDDFRFGRDRAGDFVMLLRAASQYDFRVAKAKPCYVEGERVSSTAIREALAAGDLDRAARLLGRRYSMSGRVVSGRRLGRDLGYPTANLRPGRRVLPLAGVFAAWVHGAAPTPWPAVVSLGTRPTVAGDEPLLEAHLFDFDGDLYDRRIRVEFVARLRDEERFENVAQLTEQMHVDSESARRLLARFESRAVAAPATTDRE